MITDGEKKTCDVDVQDLRVNQRYNVKFIDESQNIHSGKLYGFLFLPLFGYVANMFVKVHLYLDNDGKLIRVR